MPLLVTRGSQKNGMPFHFFNEAVTNQDSPKTSVFAKVSDLIQFDIKLNRLLVQGKQIFLDI